MKIKEIAKKIVADTQLITVASIDENGYPRPVVMVKLEEREGVIYTSTGYSAEKTKHFKANPKAGISIMSGRDSITYTGTMEIVENVEVKRSFWSDWMLEHFPDGVDGSEYCLLKFTTQSAIYYIDGEFIKE